jgi:hypothetical protein
MQVQCLLSYYILSKLSYLSVAPVVIAMNNIYCTKKECSVVGIMVRLKRMQGRWFSLSMVMIW